MREEKILASSIGKDSHFRVPAGYFDHIAERVMENLPEQEAQIIQLSWWQRLPMRKLAAAIAVVAVMGGGALWGLHHQAPQAGVASLGQTVAKSSLSSEEATFNEMADYTMMDNETIYASLLAEN